MRVVVVAAAGWKGYHATKWGPLMSDIVWVLRLVDSVYNVGLICRMTMVNMNPHLSASSHTPHIGETLMHGVH